MSLLSENLAFSGKKLGEIRAMRSARRSDMRINMAKNLGIDTSGIGKMKKISILKTK